jgi:hypothetical protein
MRGGPHCPAAFAGHAILIVQPHANNGFASAYAPDERRPILEMSAFARMDDIVGLAEQAYLTRHKQLPCLLQHNGIERLEFRTTVHVRASIRP